MSNLSAVADVQQGTLNPEVRQRRTGASDVVETMCDRPGVVACPVEVGAGEDGLPRCRHWTFRVSVRRGGQVRHSPRLGRARPRRHAGPGSLTIRLGCTAARVDYATSPRSPATDLGYATGDRLQPVAAGRARGEGGAIRLRERATPRRESLRAKQTHFGEFGFWEKR